MKNVELIFKLFSQAMDNGLHCILVFVLLGLTSCEHARVEPPNIIVIYVDDMGLGDASFTAGKVRPTPNIDRMAQEGKVFTNYYTNSPVCSPSRVAITTGMYPLRWGVNTFLSSTEHNTLCHQKDYLSDSAPSIARSLKEAGYKTAHFGKWHMGGGRDVDDAPSIDKYGFDEFSSTWESPNPDPLLTSSNWIWSPTDSIKRWERTAYFVTRTLDFLSENSGQPCFINLWPDDIHSPWVASEGAQRQDRQGYFTLPNLEPVIDKFDKQIGRLIQGINEMGMAENTLIIFTSDNGPAPTFGHKRTNGLRGGKNSLYEGGILMPFIAYWPSVIKEGQVDSTSVIAAIDLFPTLVRISGAKLPKNFSLDGENVSQALLGTEIFNRKNNIYWEYGRINPRISIPKDSVDVSPPLMVRKGKWKLLTNFEGEAVELYDLSEDPMESENRAAIHPDIAESLKDETLEWYQKAEKSEINKIQL